MLPELVARGTDEAGLLSLNYTGLVPVLVKAMQEQQATIAELRARLAALEDQTEAGRGELRRSSGCVRFDAPRTSCVSCPRSSRGCVVAMALAAVPRAVVGARLAARAVPHHPGESHQTGVSREPNAAVYGRPGRAVVCRYAVERPAGYRRGRRRRRPRGAV